MIIFNREFHIVNHKKYYLIVPLVVFTMISHATNLAKEKRWADQIVDSIMVGDAVWLKANEHKFLGIYTENTNDKAIGGAIILHGTGVHPNWPDVVQPLRSELPQYGWHTLSIQMPVLSNDASNIDYVPLFEEVAPRINAGVRFLKSRSVNNIVIIAHSLGSVMAAYYLANNKQSEISAFVAIGISGFMYKDSKLNYLSTVKDIKIPILDIYGSEDLTEILESAAAKEKTALSSANNNYQQLKVSGADHFFTNKNDVLIKHIKIWLKKYSR